MPLKKVLIIEDDRLIRITTSILLRQEGIAACTAASAAEGLELAEREKPDAILLDLQLPDGDGWEVLARLKKIAAAAHIPVLITTAADDGPSAAEARRRGALGLLRKPFNVERLLRALPGKRKAP